MAWIKVRERVCAEPRCRKRFTPAAHVAAVQRYCSSRCRQRARHRLVGPGGRLYDARAREDRPCAHCGRPMRVPVANRAKRYCSASCRQQAFYRRVRRIERQAARRRPRPRRKA